ncbi:Retinol dehydrogenase 14 [Leucoagaricus sp. SymC.cos]|nr:Retinol dehydrogenase 14 [Leucoagaricus sp. SymC.cos]
MKKSVISALFDLFQPLPQLPTASLEGKTILIIGVNTGLGFETAKYLAKLNPSRLIPTCRNMAKGNVAARRIKEETGFEGVPEVWIVELADFESVRTFIGNVVDRVKGREVEVERGLDRLDLLVLNAGVAQHTNLRYTPTKDGFEHAWSRSGELTRRMIQAADKQHLAVMDRTAIDATVDEDGGNIRDQTENRSRRQRDTKLLNMFFVRGLNNRLKSKNIIINCVNPGLCHSELRRGVQGIRAGLLAIYEKIFARKTEDGGQLIAWACIGAEGEEDSLRGPYLNVGRVEEPTDFVLREDGNRRENKL